TGVARDDEEVLEAGQRGDDVFDHAVAEIFLMGVAAQILEWQDSYRRPVRKSKRCWGCIHLSGGVQPVNLYRLGKILELLRAEIVEAKLHLAADMVEDGPRHEHAFRLGQGFKARGNVDPITIEVTPFHHHVAEIDPDSQEDTP